MPNLLLFLCVKRRFTLSSMLSIYKMVKKAKKGKVFSRFGIVLNVCFRKKGHTSFQGLSIVRIRVLGGETVETSKPAISRVLATDINLLVAPMLKISSTLGHPG